MSYRVMFQYRHGEEPDAGDGQRFETHDAANEAGASLYAAYTQPTGYYVMWSSDPPSTTPSALGMCA